MPEALVYLLGSLFCLTPIAIVVACEALFDNKKLSDAIDDILPGHTYVNVKVVEKKDDEQ